MLGIPCVMAEAAILETIQQHLQDNPETVLTVDLETMQVKYGDHSATVRMGDGPGREFFAAGSGS